MTTPPLSDAEIAEQNPPAHYAMTALLVGFTLFCLTVGAWKPAIMTSFFSVLSGANAYGIYRRTRQAA